MPDPHGNRRLRRCRTARHSEGRLPLFWTLLYPAHENRRLYLYTNTVPAGAYRGFGTLQVTWAYESQMDIIAKKLGLDPLEFRLKNLLKKGELYTPGDTPVDCELKEGLLLAAKSIGWGNKAKKPNHGKGLACCMKDGG